MAFLARSIYSDRSTRTALKVFGIHFNNPVGLAAGFDKNGKYFKEISNFGFGFIEIGTVTPKSQHGNPRPRIFRLRKDNALVNRLGFNNDGIERISSRSRSHKVVEGADGR